MFKTPKQLMNTQPQLDGIRELAEEDDNHQYGQNQEFDNEELADRVDELPHRNGNSIEKKAKAAVPSTKHSQRSVRSSKSSVYLAHLQSEIEEERKQREQLQREMEEMKRVSSELLSQLNSKAN